MNYHKTSNMLTYQGQSHKVWAGHREPAVDNMSPQQLQTEQEDESYLESIQGVHQERAGDWDRTTPWLHFPFGKQRQRRPAESLANTTAHTKTKDSGLSLNGVPGTWVGLESPDEPRQGN